MDAQFLSFWPKSHHLAECATPHSLHLIKSLLAPPSITPHHYFTWCVQSWATHIQFWNFGPKSCPLASQWQMCSHPARSRCSQSHQVFQSSYNLAYEATCQTNNAQDLIKDNEVYKVDNKYLSDHQEIHKIYKGTAPKKSYGARDEFCFPAWSGCNKWYLSFWSPCQRWPGYSSQAKGGRYTHITSTKCWPP